MTQVKSGSHRDLGPIRAFNAAACCPAAGVAGRPDPQNRYHYFAGLGGGGAPVDPAVMLAIEHQLRQFVVNDDSAAAVLNIAIAGKAKGIPAGYTYLFQLATHDLVQTMLPGEPSVGSSLGIRNGRFRPLMLDTLFGGGATGSPFLFDPDGNMRLGGMRKEVSSTKYNDKKSQNGTKPKGWEYGKVGDLPRMSFSSDGTPGPKGDLETVLIADVRNDDNLLLGQMTVLFHRLHNHLLDAISKTPVIGIGSAEEAASLILTRLYRRILRHDLMPRILHPDVLRHYADQADKGQPVRLDRAGAGNGPSLEFAFAAARLGHAMVRQKYVARLLGDSGPSVLGLNDSMATSSRHLPGSLPVPEKYGVDWTLFFQTDRQTVPEHFNWARRFGLGAAGWLLAPESFIETLVEDAQEKRSGINLRDLMRENSAGLADAATLLSHILGLDKGLAAAFGGDDPSYVQNVINGAASSKAQKALLDAASILPLSIFLKLEALERGQGGRTLGPLASVLIAEAFWPLFSPEPWEKAGPLEDCERAAVGEIFRDMPSLLNATLLKPTAAKPNKKEIQNEQVN